MGLLGYGVQYEVLANVELIIKLWNEVKLWTMFSNT
jgi:hypothetical protein